MKPSTPSSPWVSRVVAIAALAFALGMLVMNTSLCAPIAPDQAAAVVRSWLTSNQAPLETKVGTQVADVQAFFDSQAATYYVVDLAPKGFVIVSADDLVEPIVGFAADGKFDPSPAKLEGGCRT